MKFNRRSDGELATLVRVDFHITKNSLVGLAMDLLNCRDPLPTTRVEWMKVVRFKLMANGYTMVYHSEEDTERPGRKRRLNKAIAAINQHFPELKAELTSIMV